MLCQMAWASGAGITSRAALLRKVRQGTKDRRARNVTLQSLAHSQPEAPGWMSEAKEEPITIRHALLDASPVAVLGSERLAETKIGVSGIGRYCFRDGFVDRGLPASLLGD